MIQGHLPYLSRVPAEGIPPRRPPTPRKVATPWLLRIKAWVLSQMAQVLPQVHYLSPVPLFPEL